MLSNLVLVVVAASPAKASRWQWQLSESKTATGKVAITERNLQGFVLQMPPLTLDVQVTQAGDTVPRTFDVTVSAGAGLKGATYEVESNYGEAMVTKSSWKDDYENEELSNLERHLRRQLSRLTKPDPVVAAVEAGDPCSADTLEAVAKATAELASRQMSPAELRYVKGEAKCQGKGPAKKYSVAFTLSTPVGERETEFAFTGTVEVAKGAWLSDYEVKSTYEHTTDLGGQPQTLRGTVTVKSRMTKR